MAQRTYYKDWVSMYKEYKKNYERRTQQVIRIRRTGQENAAKVMNKEKKSKRKNQIINTKQGRGRMWMIDKSNTLK